MSDNGDDPVETNQARIYMRTSAANGFDGNEVEITVEGGEGEEVDDIEDVAVFFDPFPNWVDRRAGRRFEVSRRFVRKV